MRAFCDTSVLVAAVLSSHPRYPACEAMLSRIARREHIGYCSTHGLAETFSVLLRMPTTPKLRGEHVLAILEHTILPNFSIIPLDTLDYVECLRELAATNLAGGRVYDLLHLRAARKCAPERIFTLNTKEWISLSPELAALIGEPAD
jgi:predicted nucleic acid-binding protein